MSYEDKDALLYLADVRIDELDAENAKLRHDLEEANNQAEEVCIENAKLRELVLDMVEWAYIDSSCDLQEQFADRMRELGIEVG